jgi:hypothetical protein
LLLKRDRGFCALHGPEGFDRVPGSAEQAEEACPPVRRPSGAIWESPRDFLGEIEPVHVSAVPVDAEESVLKQVELVGSRVRLEAAGSHTLT